MWTVRSVKAKSWGSLLALTWSIGYMFIYLLRLPVYQHGRYIIPAMPIFFLLGLLALLEFASLKKLGRYHWLASMLWDTSVVMVTILFIILGANSYASDVALIEQEMVTTAIWVSANIPPDAVLAVHDIGALGYFDDHRLIDLAGLISPEVVPFIRDEERLTEYLNAYNANYLIAFSDLYPKMQAGREIVFVSSGTMAAELQSGHMTVFRWK